MARHDNRFLTLCAATTATLALAGTAQAVDLRSWDQKISIASKRFVVLASFNNEAVLDKETQLVWQRTPIPNVGGSHYQAASRCAGAATGGRLGWRLPFFHEMASLLDLSVPNGDPALPAGHPFMSVIAPHGIYWTATRQIVQPEFAYRVQLLRQATDQVGTAHVSDEFRTWCVRGGGSIREY